MDSIKEIYKIGHGPSSSHTMGPRKAAEVFKARNPKAASFKVTLFGSLAATGKGHLTDVTITEALSPASVDIIWHPEIVLEYHPNGMRLEALNAQGKMIDDWVVYSVGGGTITDGTETTDNKAKPLYRRHFLKTIQEYIDRFGLTFWEYVEQHEGPQIWDYLSTVWTQMQKTIEEGLDNDSSIPGCLHLRSKAKQFNRKARSFNPSLQGSALISSYALACAEQNARGAVVVTAPTCGSCGVVPAVLYYLYHDMDFPENDILKALASAAFFGNIIKTNASISGAEVGCQGEIGSACVMAAVAITQLFGGSPAQIECAAEMAMEHNLGLTCDPVCGLVQIPCIERNPMAALRAMDVSFYALQGDGRHIISFDKVVETMKRTGKDLPSLYKETALGGLASPELMNDPFLNKKY